jgi:hypothetical protein
MNPTADTYAALQAAFDYFNQQLFAGSLPPCLITLRSSPRAYGYLHRRRFVNLAGEQVDELGLNPGYFALQSREEVFSTLVHEMVHHWQHHHGQPARSVAHNKQWAAKMEAIGLMPSATGQPGGKRTGQQMSDYILPGGAFLAACAGLPPAAASLPWLDRHVAMAPAQMRARREALAASGLAAVPGTPPFDEATAERMALAVRQPAARARPVRLRQRCPDCGVSAWSAPEVPLSCGHCQTPLAPVVTRPPAGQTPP